MNDSTNPSQAGFDPGYGIAPPGYRLPGSLRLGRVVLQVADLERSLAFYTRIIGLEVGEREENRAELTPRGEAHVLIELRERPGVAPVPPTGRIGLYHFAILLPDRAALGRLVAHLAREGVRVGAADHLVSEALYLQDPDGLGIEVYADRPRSEWRHRDRQLLMATDPLDLPELARSAGAEPWTGAPAGTRLGHVHLHVGDIHRAAEFYHAALGFDRMVWSYPGALFLAAGGYHHHLGVNTWAARSPAAMEGDARLIEWEILLPTPEDSEAAATSLESRGFAVDRTAVGAVVARDPWGTTVRLRSDQLQADIPVASSS
jgi:catechol 2,3-dioxygenase